MRLEAGEVSEVTPVRPTCAASNASSFSGILRCPVCAASLADPKSCAACGTEFLEHQGLPVLIDFADSIFTPADYASASGSVIERDRSGGRLGRFLTNLTYGRNEVTPRLIDKFLSRLRGKKRVLVVGGGSIGSGMEKLYSAPRIEVIGTDVYPSPNIVAICDGHKLPFVDESFDGVVVQAVLEHVVEPHRVVAEIRRVLAPDGLVYAETPFMQQVHEAAYDFTRFTLSGHRWLFRGFDEMEAGQVLGPGTALLWSISYYLRAVGLGPRMTTLVTSAFFWTRLLERRGKPGPSLDAASGLYFLGAKSSEMLPANALPAYYAAKR